MWPFFIGFIMLMATIITVYKQPKLVEMLLNAMHHPGFHFYLHIDKKVDIREFIHLQQLPNVFILKERIDIKWAGYSMVQALLSGIQHVLATGIAYDFINHMSAQCYPLKPIQQIHDYFDARKQNIFLSCHPPPSDWWSEAKTRHERYNLHEFSFPGRHRLATVLTTLLPKRRLPLYQNLYGGPLGAYWTMTRDCAQYLTSALADEPRIGKFFKLSWGPDEIMFNSMIMNSPYRNSVINNNLRYIDWSAGGAHPKILTQRDLETIMRSGCFFARKFDLDIDAKFCIQLMRKSYLSF